MILHALLLAPLLLSAPEAQVPIDEIPVQNESGKFLLPIEALLERGDLLLDRADRASVDQAEEMYKFALQIDANSAPAHGGLARVAAIRFSRRFKEDDALVDLALQEGRRAVESAPLDPRAQAALAIAGLVAEDAPTAADAADRAWAQRSPSTPAWVAEAVASVLTAVGSHEAALRILDEARRSHPERVQNHYVTGNALMELGRLDEALTSYERAVLLDANFTPALLQMAHAYDRLNNLNRAGQLYRTVVERSPWEKPRVFARMAASLMSRGKYGDALVLLEKAQFANKRGLGQGSALYMKALCLEKTSKLDDARPLYRRVIDECPLASYGTIASENLAASSYEALARLDLAAGKQEEAVRLLEEAMRMDRPTLGLFLGLAQVYSDYGLQDDAVKTLRRASEIDFGPRQAGPKVAIFVAWARVLKAQKISNEDARRSEMLASLDAFAPALAGGGDLIHLLEAARACSILGDTARGIAWVGRAVERGYRHLDWIEKDEEMAPLARAPGFSTLRSRSTGS